MNSIEIDELRRKSRAMVFMMVAVSVAVIGFNAVLFTGIELDKDVLFALSFFVIFSIIYSIAQLFTFADKISLHRKYNQFSTVKELCHDYESEHNDVLKVFRYMAIAKKSYIICGGVLLLDSQVLLLNYLGESYAQWFFVFTFAGSVLYFNLIDKLIDKIYESRDKKSPRKQYLSYFIDNVAASVIKKRYGLEFNCSPDIDSLPELIEKMKLTGVRIGFDKSQKSGAFKVAYSLVECVYEAYNKDTAVYVLRMTLGSGKGARTYNAIFAVIESDSLMKSLEKRKNVNVGFCEFQKYVLIEKCNDMVVKIANPRRHLYNICYHLDQIVEIKERL